MVDIGFSTGAFYTNVMPEADILKLSETGRPEQRQNGGYDLINKIWAEKANMRYLAKVVEFTPFHLYLNKKIDKPDLTGLKIRITPVYRDFFQAMNAAVMTTAPGEVYTALERGVIDGYGWPITAVRPQLAGEDQVPRRSRLLQRRGVAGHEPRPLQGPAAEGARIPRPPGARLRVAERFLEELQPERGQAPGQVGIEVITFDPATNKAYVEKAKEIGWANAIKASPSTASS